MTTEIADETTDIADELFALFAAAGAASYGERLTVTDHSLQAAYFAARAAALPSLVLAALVHDIGHLLGGAPDDIGEWQRDAEHEIVGARWLAARFPPDVAEPVRLHVAAKRYLCATEPGYVATLSPASQITLKLQGGPMTAPEVRAFVDLPFQAAAVDLRRWDDLGKLQNLVTPTLATYRPLIDSLAST